MPARPPICPAFEHARSASLATIPEDIFPFYGSPLLPHESAVFAGFEYPVPPAAFSPNTGFSFDSANRSSPGLSRKLDTLSLSYKSLDPVLGDVDSPRVKKHLRHLSASTSASEGLGLDLLKFDFQATAPLLPFLSKSAVDEDFAFEEDDVDRSSATACKSVGHHKATLTRSDASSSAWTQAKTRNLQGSGHGEQGFGAIVPVLPFTAGSLEDGEAAIITERKIVRISNPTIASLKSTASIIRTPVKAKAGSPAVYPEALLPGQDESSPRNGIFSPTGRPRMISMVMGASPAHKRKASTTSITSIQSSASVASNSTSASGHKSKRIRRLSASISSTRSSLSLSPLFSSAFFRSMASGNVAATRNAKDASGKTLASSGSTDRLDVDKENEEALSYRRISGQKEGSRFGSIEL